MRLGLGISRTRLAESSIAGTRWMARQKAPEVPRVATGPQGALSIGINGNQGTTFLEHSLGVIFKQLRDHTLPARSDYRASKLSVTP
jgi:hypothetical protein